MENNFLGKWICNGKSIDIKSVNKKTFVCSFKRSNIGILFNNSLIVSEFDDDVQSGGVGVYSPVGDGSAYAALWSNTKLSGLLGSGIALKSEVSDGIIGEYSVKYFVGKNEVNSFDVMIDYANSKEIYNLAWYKNGQKALHGIGVMIGDSLAIAWGSIACQFDLDILSYNSDHSDAILMKTIRWNDTKINSLNLIGNN